MSSEPPLAHDDDDKACPRGEGACPIYSQVELLRHEVRTDALTGLGNIRELHDSLDQEMERTRRSLQPTSLIMLDIDHFKQVNDTYGHLLGDKILQHLSRQLRESLRKLDIPCRYGGEEFAIILPSTPSLIAIRVADRLREQIAAKSVSIDSNTVSVTVSIGVETFLPHHRDSVTELIDRADQQLYRAKRDGRNCVRNGASDTVRTRSLELDEKQALDDLFNA